MNEKDMVLIVDDQEDLVYTLQALLESEGYMTEAAHSGLQALDIGARYPFDVALLDIKLPDMRGTRLIPALLEKNPDMVIIMLTGFPDQENTMEALNLGAAGYLIKPPNPETLLDMVRTKLQQQREATEMTQERVGKFIERRLEKMKKTQEL